MNKTCVKLKDYVYYKEYDENKKEISKYILIPSNHRLYLSYNVEYIEFIDQVNNKSGLIELSKLKVEE